LQTAATLITILLLGDSQIVGKTGQLLEKRYEDHGIIVYREAANGKGVDYFLSATRQNNILPSYDDNFEVEEILMYHAQRERIKNYLNTGVDYIMVGALGGNDAYRGCCSGRLQRQRMIRRYRKLFEQLCSYNVVVIFNGSPRASIQRHRLFDTRREMIDRIQKEASIDTCVMFNSVREMQIQSDSDGYHYNKNANLYVDFLMNMPSMRLPILEGGGSNEIR
jgi:hypothetical protein